MESDGQIGVIHTDTGVTLRINTERFNFSCHRSFREAYKNLPPSTKLQVDFMQVNYMDSSALGMLLLLREHLGSEKESIRFINCNKSILNIFSVANFQKIFSF
ncbi:MAG: STAS domain-containing protein [Magnetococcales bacterium]|nr:STAS domain-containing protein [Magnetococcales bacterium]